MTPYDRPFGHGRVRVVDVGSGPALVLVHGLGGTWRNWEANIPALAREHRVIALDLPGFGDSDPLRANVGVDQYVDTVVELLDQLGVPEATFVGNSMGGLITIETALRRPELVQAAVLVCSGGLPLTSARHRLLTVPQARLVNRVLRLQVARWVVRRSERLRLLLGGRVFHDPRTVPPELLGAALTALGAAGFGAALAAGAGYDARLRAPSLTCPTLVLWGREDPLLPVAMGHELHRLIPGSRLEVWEHTGHCPMLEHPARFDERIASFVAQVNAGPPNA